MGGSDHESSIDWEVGQEELRQLVGIIDAATKYLGHHLANNGLPALSEASRLTKALVRWYGIVNTTLNERDIQ